MTHYWPTHHKETSESDRPFESAIATAEKASKQALYNEKHPEQQPASSTSDPDTSNTSFARKARRLGLTEALKLNEEAPNAKAADMSTSTPTDVEGTGASAKNEQLTGAQLTLVDDSNILDPRP